MVEPLTGPPDRGRTAPETTAPKVATDAPAEAQDGRPLVERLGLAVIAALLAGVFGFVALAAWTAGELFLATMAGIGALMTVWAAIATLRRG